MPEAKKVELPAFNRRESSVSMSILSRETGKVANEEKELNRFS